jgi:hypothetical protein
MRLWRFYWNKSIEKLNITANFQLCILFLFTIYFEYRFLLLIGIKVLKF